MRQSLFTGALLGLFAAAALPAMAQNYAPAPIGQSYPAQRIPSQTDRSSWQGVKPVYYTTSCEFDAYQHFDEQHAKNNDQGFIHNPYQDSNPYIEDFGGCDGNCGNGSGPCDFQCVECWSFLNFEKRLLVAWAYDCAYSTATRWGYGDAHSAQLGLEALPFVCYDGDTFYTRWGFTAMYAYSHYVGNKEASLQNGINGTVWQAIGGDQNSFMFGPTIRTDFNLGPVRLSPNVFSGVTFNWTNMQIGPPDLADFTFRNRVLDHYKSNGFDVGGVVRAMLDIGLTKYTTFGVGGEFRFADTDIDVRYDEFRKSTGLVLQLTYAF